MTQLLKITGASPTAPCARCRRLSIVYEVAKNVSIFAALKRLR
jgi:hypothetical protein